MAQGSQFLVILPWAFASLPPQGGYRSAERTGQPCFFEPQERWFSEGIIRPDTERKDIVSLKEVENRVGEQIRSPRMQEMKDMPRRPSKPKHASKIMAAPCDCGCGYLHITLLDERERPIATAWVGPDLLSELTALVWPPNHVERKTSAALH